MGANKIKGIYKGFKCFIQIFVVKEDRELEIGCPTDVQHVAHIGWNGSTENPPSWMSGFKTVPEFSKANSYGTNPRESTNSMFFTPWSSPDLHHESTKLHQLSGSCMLDQTISTSESSSKPKKHKRRKKTTSSSSASKGLSSSLSKTLRSSSKTKSGFNELESTMGVLA